MLGYGNGYNAYLDNYLEITPFYGLTADQNHLTLHVPLQIFLPKQKPPTVVVALPPAFKVADAAIDPVRTNHPFLLQGKDGVWMLDAITGKTSELTRLSHPHHLCVGGLDHNFYVATDSALVGLLDNGTQFASQPVATPLDAVTCDPSIKRVIGYSSRSNSLYLFDEGLLLPAIRATLPARVPGSSDAPVQFEYDSKAHTYVLHRDGSPYVLRVLLRQDGTMSVTRLALQGVSSARGLSVDQWGRMYTSILTVNGAPVMQAFDAAGNRIDSPFNGDPGGGIVRMLKPFDNFDPSFMKGRSFYNVLPPTGPNGG